MLKTVLAISLTAAALSWIPAQAAETVAQAATGNSAPSSGAAAAARNYQCTDSDMAEIQASGEKMTDATKKGMFMKEMQMAKDSMGKKDQQGCADHMKNLTNMFAN